MARPRGYTHLPRKQPAPPPSPAANVPAIGPFPMEAFDPPQVNFAVETPDLVLNRGNVSSPMVPVAVHDAPKVNLAKMAPRQPPLPSAGNSLGRQFCDIAIPLSQSWIDTGTKMQDAGIGIVVPGAIATAAGAVAGASTGIGAFVGAAPGAAVTTVGLGIDSAGTATRLGGAGLLAIATGDFRPAAKAVLGVGLGGSASKVADDVLAKIARGRRKRHLGKVVEPFIDYGIDALIGPDGEAKCIWD